MAVPRVGLSSAAGVLGIGFLLAGAACTHESLPVPTAAQPCPPWVLFPPDYHSNADSPYLGCVVAANLRAMVANPADLERGRPLGPGNGERQTLAVEAYQQDKVKPLQSVSSTSGAGGGGGTGGQ
jgi:type IV pilus biogenesis protein CpaD/CtpE